jgi:hypothetical protein
MRLKSVSATQIKQYQGCELQWYLQRVEGWEYPQSDSQALGEQVHAEMERYLLTGVEPLHPSALAAIKGGLVPAKGQPVIVEEPKDFAMGMTCADVPVKGRIDVLLPPVNGPIVCLDWKTAKSFDYTPSPEELARDTQGVLYLEYAYRQFGPMFPARFDHVYLKTKGTGAKRVEGEQLVRAEVAAMYAGLETVVEKMKSTAGRKLSDVTGNLKNCDKYGGCKFRDRCPSAQSLGLVELLGGTTAQGDNVSKLTDILKARKAAIGVTPPDAPAPSPAPAPYVPTSTQPVADDDKPEAWVKASAPAPTPEPVVEPVEERPKSVVEVTYAKTEKPYTFNEPIGELVLYVDCAPDRGEYTYLESEILARTPSLLEHLRKTSAKDVPEGAMDLAEVAYGRGLATLSASFVLRPITGEWVVNSASSASAKVLEVLIPKAARVIRGRR